MSLLDDIDITMLKGDIEMVKNELLLKINDLETELLNKLNSDDFRYENNKIDRQLNMLYETIEAYKNKLDIFGYKLEYLDNWFTQLAAYAQQTSQQDFKEIANKITEYKSIE